MFPVPPSVWDTFDEFYRPTGNRGQGFISRFVKLTFHRVGQLPGAAGTAAGPMPPLSFGRIELYGRPLHPEKDNTECPVPVLPPQLQMSESEMNAKEEEYKKAVYTAIEEEKICFDTALELEVLRLKNKISSAHRDEIMTTFGMPSELSPLSFMYRRDEKLEGKGNASMCILRPHFFINIHPFLKNKTEDINGSLRKICCKCQNRYFVSLCSYCRKMYCKKCMDFKPIRITEYLWDSHDVCKDCFARITLQSSLLEQITSLHSTKIYVSHTHNARFILFRFISFFFTEANVQEQTQRGTTFAGGFVSEFQHHKDNYMLSPADLGSFKSAEMNLAVYPYAALVNSIPCDKDSSIPEIMFTPGYADKYWAAPAGTRSVEITIGLQTSSLITLIELTPGPLGYNEDWEAPNIKIKAGETLNDELLDEYTSCTTTVENAKKPNCVVKGTLESSLYGRIIVVQASLPEAAPPEARLHIGKMVIRGKSLIPIPLDDETGANGARFTVPNSINERAFTARRQQCFIPLRVTKIVRKTKGFTDVYVNTSRSVNIHGFTVTVEHGSDTENGAETQVRLFRVSVLVMAHERTLSKMYVGLFPVPKCVAGTTLAYRFEDIAIGNVVRLEHVSNYGSREITTPGKLSIF